MTYLDLVNNVLRRLREDKVTTVNSNTYSKMVSDFINDAKNFVRNAWDWSQLRSTLTITTAADDYTNQTHPTPVSYTHLTLPTIYSV